MNRAGEVVDAGVSAGVAPVIVHRRRCEHRQSRISPIDSFADNTIAWWR